MAGKEDTNYNGEVKMDIGWDKSFAKTLVDNGLDWEKARIVVGLVAEQRQIADREGYTRGYNNGYADAEKKFRNQTDTN